MRAPSFNSSEKGDFYQHCFKPGTLQAFTPKTNAVSIVRFLPEIAPDGTPYPMARVVDAQGIDYSNFWFERVAVAAGTANLFTGLVRPLGMDGRVDLVTDEPNLPWSGLFIQLKGRLKKGQINPMLVPVLQTALAKRQGDRPGALDNPGSMHFAQGVVIMANNAALAQMQTNTAIVLKQSAFTSFDAIAKAAYLAGIDIFSPSGGCYVKFWGLPPKTLPGQEQASMQCGLCDYNGNVMQFPGMPQLYFPKGVNPTLINYAPSPIPDDFCRSAWHPWEDCFLRFTRDDHIKKMVSAFGPVLVAEAFGDDIARLGIPLPQMATGYPPQAPAGYPQAPGYPPQAPAGYPQAPAPAAPWGNHVAPVAPVATVNPWPAPAAPMAPPAAPAAAPANPWGNPAAPAAAPAAPWGNPAAPAAPVAPAAPANPWPAPAAPANPWPAPAAPAAPAPAAPPAPAPAAPAASVIPSSANALASQFSAAILPPKA